MNYNGLTEAQVERLSLLVEECGEVIQVVGGILRHGYEPDGIYDNRGDLETEIGHVGYAMALLEDSKDISGEKVQEHLLTKIENVKRYLHHQSEEILDGLQESFRTV